MWWNVKNVTNEDDIALFPHFHISHIITFLSHIFILQRQAQVLPVGALAHLAEGDGDGEGFTRLDLARSSPAGRSHSDRLSR